MEGLERIHQQILQEAREEAQQIEKAAKDKRDSFLQTEQAKADSLYETALQDLKGQQQRRRSQLKAELSMNERRALLETKQAWIRKVLDEALRQLAARPAQEKLKDYLANLESEELAAERKEQAGAKPVIELSVQDAALVGDLQKALPFEAEVRADRRDFTAGLLVTVGLVHFNYTYEESMRRREADFIGTVGSLLFA